MCQSVVEIVRTTEGTTTQKLIAVLAAAGVTDAKQLAELLGVTDRAIRKARNHSSEKGTTVPEPQFRDGTTVPQTEPEFRNHSSASRAHKESPSEIDSTEEEVKIIGAPKAKRRLKASDAPANGRRLEQSWTLPPNWRTWAETNFPAVPADQIDLQADRFRDYWIAQPGAKGRKLDWEATWRNWCRNGLVTGTVRKPQYTAAYQTQGPEAFSDCYQ